jgi:hypothetical protein
MSNKKSDKDTIVRAGCVQDDPKGDLPAAKPAPAFDPRDGAALAFMNRPSTPEFRKAQEAFARASQFNPIADASAFSASISRGGAVRDPGPRKAEAREVPIQPPPGISAIDALVDAYLPPGSGRPKP